MEESASQWNKLSLSKKETDGFVPSKEHRSSEFLSAPFTTHGKEGIYVPGFYEHKQTFMRKVFYLARMESEGIETEASEGRSEKDQASRETEGESIINKGVSHVNDETVMRETLHLVSAIPVNQDSTSIQLSTTEIQESMDMDYNEGATRLANDLIPLGVTFDTLFEIQIKDIVVDIARFNRDSGREGLQATYFCSISPKPPHPPYRGLEWVIWKPPP